MQPTSSPGWLLVIAGVMIAGLGLLWLVGSSIPGFGRLPGDIRYEGERVRFYFPLATCLLVRLALSAVFWILRFFSRS